MKRYFWTGDFRMPIDVVRRPDQTDPRNEAMMRLLSRLASEGAVAAEGSARGRRFSAR